ncbi:MAG: diguanylate cyclase, partial [Burkholderiales bacterium]|nr:diguanylate cyclase [Burkholderiales bacterium]
DEFIVLLKDLTHQDKAEAIATKIIAQATAPLIINERVTVHIGASIGISSSGPQAFDVDRLLRQADGAMYQVKQHGRNAYRVADPSSV